MPFELRTTVVEGLVTLRDIDEISGFVQGVPLYALQSFVGRDTLDPAYTGLGSVPLVIMQEMARHLEAVVSKVVVRSI